jgi:hypothetical protein
VRGRELSDHAFVHQHAAPVGAAKPPRPGPARPGPRVLGGGLAGCSAESQLLRLELDLIDKVQAGRDATSWGLAIAVDAGTGFA